MRFNPWFALGVLLAAAGVLFYIVMGLRHGGWADVGVYSITVTLVGFGALGALVSRGQTATA